MKISERYGTVLRCYDDGGRSFDRYTILPPRWAREYRERAPGSWTAIGASENPFHPQGFGQSTIAMPGPHLGRRIAWRDLPEDVRRFALQSFPDFAPRPRDVWTWEYTDTFGGEANYSWVRRGTIELPHGASDAAVTRAIKRAAGLAGVRGRRDTYGDDGALYPYGSCTVLFWRYVGAAEVTP